jgi:hypothetical protein
VGLTFVMNVCVYILLWRKRCGVMVVLNVCVVNIVMENGRCCYGCTECVCCEYFYGEREVGLTVELNVCVVNIVIEKGRWG